MPRLFELTFYRRHLSFDIHPSFHLSSLLSLQQGISLVMPPRRRGRANTGQSIAHRHAATHPQARTSRNSGGHYAQYDILDDEASEHDNDGEYDDGAHQHEVDDEVEEDGHAHIEGPRRASAESADAPLSAMGEQEHPQAATTRRMSPRKSSRVADHAPSHDHAHCNDPTYAQPFSSTNCNNPDIHSKTIAPAVKASQDRVTPFTSTSIATPALAAGPSTSTSTSTATTPAAPPPAKTTTRKIGRPRSKNSKLNASGIVRARKSTAGAPRVHSCTHCEKSFARRSDLQRHVRTHLNDK